MQLMILADGMTLSRTTLPAGHRARRPRRSGRPTPEQAAQLDQDVRECALRLFLEHGYDGTSMDAIASAAGTTKVSLYARFENKEELFNSVLWWALQRRDWPEPESAPPDLDDLQGALLAIAEGAIRRALHPAMIKLSRIAAAYALRFPEIARRAHMSGFSPRYQLLMDLLKRHAAKGTIVSEDLPALAEHFLAMVSGGPARLASFGIVREPAAQQRRLRVAVDLFMRGLHP
jgi:AcrR family transcriptional regulator